MPALETGEGHFSFEIPLSTTLFSASVPVVLESYEVRLDGVLVFIDLYIQGQAL